MVKKAFKMGLIASLFLATPIVNIAANNEIPLYMDQFGFKIPFKDSAIRKSNDVYLPLSCIKKLSPYSYKVEGNSLDITIPKLHAKNNELLVESYENGYKRQYPLVKINDKLMINAKYLGYYLGVTKEVEDGAWVLSMLKGRIPAIEKEPLQGKIALSFDPMASDEVSYNEPFNKAGTSIISPSFFSLTKTGIQKEKVFNSNYVKKYDNNGFRVWPLITNQFDPKLTHEIVTDKSLWDTYVNDLGNLALKEGYQGYNFDFENVYYKDKDDLAKFVEYLAKGLHNFGLYTSMDVTGYSNSLRWSKVYDRKQLSNYVDYLVLMAYDEVGWSSKVAGPVASYPWVKSHLSMFIDEVPPEKTLLGIPLYMREWRTSLKGIPFSVKANDEKNIAKESNFENSASKMNSSLDFNFAASGKNSKNDKRYLSNNQDSVKENKSIKKNNINEFESTNEDNNKSINARFNLDRKALEKVTPKALTLSIKRSYEIKREFGEDMVWLPKLELHYLEYINDGYFTQIWFEDEDSLLKKIKLAKDSNIAGVAFWRKDFEDEKTHNFIKNNLF